MKEKLLFYRTPDCEYCEEAKSAASEVANEFGIQLEEKEATGIGKHLDVPAVCVVDAEGEERCTIGFEDSTSFKAELRRMLRPSVAV